MITGAESTTYRQHLLSLLGRLGKDRSQLKDEALRPTGGEASGSLSDLPLHPADLASHGFEEDLTLGLLENEEQLIEEVNLALERLEKGTYGLCMECHREIALKRLKALPYVRYCVGCAAKSQQKIST